VCPTRRSRVVFQQVKLYDAEMIYQLDRLRQAASRNLAGYSTGLGFWGSLKWVPAGSLITGVLEQSLSSQMAAEGVAQLRQAAALALRIREQASYVPVSRQKWSAISQTGVVSLRPEGIYRIYPSNSTRWQIARHRRRCEQCNRNGDICQRIDRLNPKEQSRHQLR
jgi:hypothetical protein